MCVSKRLKGELGKKITNRKNHFATLEGCTYSIDMDMFPNDNPPSSIECPQEELDAMPHMTTPPESTPSHMA